jgi:hypothetical protein
MPRPSRLAPPQLPMFVRRRIVAARRLLVRRPWVYWFAVGALAAGAYASVGSHTAARDAARAEWGATTPVLVARTPLAPGDALDGRVAIAQWPAAIVPPDALVALAPGRVARQHVAPGDAVGALDVAPDGGPLALVPDGWVAVPVVESPASGAAVGDRVQVTSEGVLLAHDGVVVGSVVGATAGDVTLVAVPADVAPLLAAAADSGQLTLLRVP